MNQSEIEEEACTFIGEKLVGFGYGDGCVILWLGDGRELTIGSSSPIWWSVDIHTVQ